jgi:NhaP-type Na+/H+ or K+/H+ antiporter
MLHFFSNIVEKERKERNESERVILNETVLSSTAKTFYNEIFFFVKTFFFVYVGIIMDFTNIQVFIYSAAITLAVFMARPISVWITFIGEKVDTKSRTMMNIFVPKGLAAAVLAQLAVQKAIPNSQLIVDLVFGTVFMSILFTSILIFIFKNKLSESENSKTLKTLKNNLVNKE